MIFALGIHHIGLKAAKLLANHFVSMDALLAASEEDIKEIDGMGDISAKTLKDTLSLPETIALIEDFKAFGLNMKNLTECAKCISEISNLAIQDNLPYIGKSAFSHKGGMHIDGDVKLNKSFEHISPESVGNHRQFLISEMSGKTAVLSKINKFAPDITKDSPELVDIIEMLKMQEQKGYQYEAAEASFELLVRKFLGRFTPYFEIIYFKIICEQDSSVDTPACGLVKIRVGGRGN